MGRRRPTRALAPATTTVLLTATGLAALGVLAPPAGADPAGRGMPAPHAPAAASPAPAAAPSSGPTPSPSPPATAPPSPPAAAPANPNSSGVAQQAPSAAASCGTLATGSQGSAVATIQAVVGAATDGDFGPQTQQLLERWQRRHHIPATGVVDLATWGALPQKVSWRACGQQVTAVPPSGARKSCAALGSGDVGPAVAVLQAGLGTDVDGGFGPDTAAAVRALQHKQGWKTTGSVGYRTWKVLGLTSTPACEPGPAGSPSSTPPPGPPDAKRQARIRARVQRIVAGLTAPAKAPSPLSATAVGFARSQLGKPYRYGAEGPDGYDCSGLVMAAYDAAALPMPRVAAAQYAAGPHLPLSQVARGDLLFWASDVAKPSTVYHTAIYLGSGKILDAPHTGTDVQVQDLWSTDLLPTVVRPVVGLQLPVRLGDTGAAVTAVQTALTHHGYEVSVDGGYGPQTRAAVKDWQKRQHLRPTGRVALNTWLTLGWTPGH